MLQSDRLQQSPIPQDVFTIADRYPMTLYRTAHSALAAFGITGASLRALNTGFNTTYRVTVPDGTRYALRLGTNSLRDAAGLHAELSWIQALADSTDITVAPPCRTADGAPFVRVAAPSVNRDIYATLTRWLPGRLVGDKPSRAQLTAMGSLMAHLHRHTAQWSPPPGASFPSLTHILMNSTDILTTSTHACLTPALRDCMARVIERIQPHYEGLGQSQPTQVIHADLHGYNVLWHEQRIAVIDFDDAGIGWPIQDLAICAYHLRTNPGAEAYVNAGYQQIAPLPVCDPAAFEAQLIARGILMLNDVLGSPIAADVEFAPIYAERLMRRMACYLDTGVFQMLM